MILWGKKWFQHHLKECNMASKGTMRNFKSILFIVFTVGCFLPSGIRAQQYITALAGQTQTFSVAGSEIFTDPRDAAGQGGPGGVCTGTSSGNLGDYPNCGCTTISTLCAPAGGRVAVNFTTFNIFGNFDILNIYDGTTITAPVIFNSNLTTTTDELAGMIASYGSSQFTSSGQCLTFSFLATTVVNSCGWTANVTLPTGNPGGGGGTGGACTLICAANQQVSLQSGECGFQIPNYVTLSVDNCSYNIVKKSALGTGDIVGPGNYVLQYELNTPSGLVADKCSVNLSVLPTPNVSDNVVCNDHVNISVDENCKVTLTSDAFLEGGPYACFTSYQINVLPNQSEAAMISNVPQGVALSLPYGVHGYEIVGPSGATCRGTFLVEDKQAPVVNCACVDNPTITAVSSFSGTITATDPTFNRPTATTTCTLGTTAKYYDVYPFQVSVTGSYTFNANGSQGDTYAIIYTAPFDPANPCVNFIVGNDDGAGDLDPLITTNLTAGVDYVLVFTTFGTQIATGAYTMNMTGAGQVQVITNPANAPECQFRCVDIEVVKRETVGMLYNIPGQNANKAKLSLPPVVKDCSNLNISFEDKISSVKCGKTKLVRDWTFVDAAGNTSVCTQTFSFNSLEFEDLTPPSTDVQLTCGVNVDPASVAAFKDVDSRTGTASTANIGGFADDFSATPGVVELNEGFISGYYTYKQIGFDGMLHDQKADVTLCNLNISYKDDVFAACGLGCGGNQKIVRTWQIFDDCNRKISEHVQLIHAVDDKAPAFGVRDVTINMDPIGCQAEWVVEKPWELQDNCNSTSEIRWGVLVPAGLVLEGSQPTYKIKGLTSGTVTVTYWAEDCCGNRTEKNANITVIDVAPPVALAKRNLVLSLTGSGVDQDGSAKIYAWQVDNGSYDNCSPIKVEIRRKTGGACENTGLSDHNNNSTFNNHSDVPSEVPQQSWFHPFDNKNDNDGGAYVKFCCEDIPDGQSFGEYEVEMRVWDDANNNSIYGDNLIINGLKDNYATTWATIRVENKIAPAIVCPKEVTVTCDTELYLSLEKESPVSNANLSVTGSPVTSDLCTSLGMTYKDAWIGNSNVLCKTGTIRRDFFVEKGTNKSSCSQIITVSGLGKAFTVTFPQRGGVSEWPGCSLSLEDVRNASNSLIKNPILDYGQCDIVGENITIDTFLFEDGACKKWRVTYKYINWCTGQEITTLNGQPIVYYYTYKDAIAPVMKCENIMVTANPNPLNPNGGCEGVVKLTATASDVLVCADESWIKWQSYVDLWANGTVDRIGSSFVNKAWNGIWARQDKFVAGQLNPNWTALQAQHPGITFANTVFVSYIPPTKSSGGVVNLPDFTLDAENISHPVIWKTTDGCGNVSQCESSIMVVDKKSPTPYCVGLSTALMQVNPRMVELWAKDFDKGSFDNCTPQGKLYFTFRENGNLTNPVLSKLNEEHFFKGAGVSATSAEYSNGKAYKWLPSSRTAGRIFTAAGKINLEVSVWDENLNQDFCTIELTIVDNTPPMTRISGVIRTKEGLGLMNAEVIPTSMSSGVMGSVMTDEYGNFDVDIQDDTQLGVSKDGDDLNGVTTLDLVMIQRHILGIQTMPSPYQVIAADATNDGRLSAADLTEIRKLILKLLPEFSVNTSWRFPVESQNMNPSQPFPFEEQVMTYAGLPQQDLNFVAVKIGDVSGNAIVNQVSGIMETRTNQVLTLLAGRPVQQANSDLVEIPVYNRDLKDISGLQLALTSSIGEIIGIQPMGLPLSKNQYSIIQNVLRISFTLTNSMTLPENMPVFSLVIKVKTKESFPEIQPLDSGWKNEAYGPDLRILEVALSKEHQSQASALSCQNEPNPFRQQTTIGIQLVENAVVQLQIFDVNGKVVMSKEMHLNRGVHQEIITREQLGNSGVYYYTITANGKSESRKMILVE